MKFKFNIKPKINTEALVQDKELEFKSLDTKIEFGDQIDTDVTFKANIEGDLVNKEVKNAKFSFTKKF